MLNECGKIFPRRNDRGKWPKADGGVWLTLGMQNGFWDPFFSNEAGDSISDGIAQKIQAI